MNKGKRKRVFSCGIGFCKKQQKRHGTFKPRRPCGFGRGNLQKTEGNEYYISFAKTDKKARNTEEKIILYLKIYKKALK